MPTPERAWAALRAEAWFVGPAAALDLLHAVVRLRLGAGDQTAEFLLGAAAAGACLAAVGGLRRRRAWVPAAWLTGVAFTATRLIAVLAYVRARLPAAPAWFFVVVGAVGLVVISLLWRPGWVARGRTSHAA